MSIYSLVIRTLTGEPATLAAHRTDVLLIVNVASMCGYTPQYEGLERLYRTYAARGFTVLGFPCNQFGEEEPGTAAEIGAFCSRTYGVTFPMFAKIDVNGPAAHPLYRDLTAHADAARLAGDVEWNFEKFLVAPGAASITRFRPDVEPEDERLLAAIERLLPAR